MRITAAPAEADHVDLAGLDLTDPYWYASGDPHSAWRALRLRDPVHLQELPDGRRFWSVVTAADCRTVLADAAVFTSERGALLGMLGRPDPAAGVQMAVTDPPRHTAMRTPLRPLLAAGAAAREEESVRRFVRSLLAPFGAGEEFDLGAAMLALPMAVTGVLMGLPEQDWPDLVRWGTMTIAPDDPDFGLDGGPGETLTMAQRGLLSYFTEELARRDGEVRDDLIGRLMSMRVEGRRLSAGDIASNCYSFLLGANVNTGHAVSAALTHFLDRPELYRAWAARPGSLRSGVEEAVRWASPVVHFMRHTTREVTLRGVTIPAGEAVVAWIASANRDEALFRQPYRFDVARQPNRHVAFGEGPHYCIGAAAARTTLRAAFAEIFRTVESFEALEPPAHLVSNFTAGIKRFRLRATPCAA